MRKVKIRVNLGGCGVGYMYHFFLDHWTHFYEEKVKLHGSYCYDSMATSAGVSISHLVCYRINKEY